MQTQEFCCCRRLTQDGGWWRCGGQGWRTCKAGRTDGRTTTLLPFTHSPFSSFFSDSHSEKAPKCTVCVRIRTYVHTQSVVKNLACLLALFLLLLKKPANRTYAGREWRASMRERRRRLSFLAGKSQVASAASLSWVEQKGGGGGGGGACICSAAITEL